MNQIPIVKILPLVFVLLLAGAWGCGGGQGAEPLPDSHATAEAHQQAEEYAEGQENGEHEEEGIVRLEKDGLEQMGIRLDTAGAGLIEVTVDLPGEVQIDGDRMAHVGPRVGGVVREVDASLGDAVNQGQLLATLESRELAGAKAGYLATAERKSLADATFEREQRLWKKKVSSEQEYLDARTRVAEAAIELRSAEQKLHALGFAEQEIRRLPAEAEADYTTYRITAPFHGEVIDRHITIGETIAPLTPVFTIADLSTVWIDLRVYQKDLPVVTGGQRVRMRATQGPTRGEGVISFVQPLVGEDTRTALARIILPNRDRRWKPGMFVTGTVITDAVDVSLRIPRTAIIPMEDGDQVVFVETDEGFEARPVAIGRGSPTHVEVLKGLNPGDRYVAEGAFSLKAELAKASFGEGHGH